MIVLINFINHLMNNPNIINKFKYLYNKFKKIIRITILIINNKTMKSMKTMKTLKTMKTMKTVKTMKSILIKLYNSNKMVILIN